LGFLTSWANAPFAVAIGAVGVFALLQATGLLGLIAGADGDHDVDHDVEGDVDHDADADADHDADGDHDADERSFASAALGALGFGTIPFSMIWQSFGLAFATIGLLMNARYFGQAGGPPVLTLAWTVPTAFAGGCGAVAALNRVLGPVLSSKGQEATSRAQLVGQMGVVISSRVTADFGEVRIRDRSGHDLRVVCRLAQGTKTVPLERQTVVVVDCDEKGALTVAPLDDDHGGTDGDDERDGEERANRADLAGRRH